MDGPTHERRLMRPRDGRMIGGVCAAFSRYFGVDVTLIRLLWVFLVLCVGTGLLAYVIAWIVIPEEDAV